jgi:hypothetical protein
MCSLPLTAMAVDQNTLDAAVTVAAKANGEAYLEARRTIVNFGTNVLPLLAKTARDDRRTWQEQLVARISYERLSRGEEIEALRNYDWRTDPRYDKRWEQYIIGPVAELGMIAIPKCIETGLWYYYIELHWKRTREVSRFSAPRIEEFWDRWCRRALDNEPERYFFLRAISERLEKNVDFHDHADFLLYNELRKSEIGEAMPTLIRCHRAYFSRLLSAPPEQKPETYRNNFDDLLKFADSRHADLIEKTIQENPTLVSLMDRVAEIRKRPARSALAEPPFRLGHQPVLP